MAQSTVPRFRLPVSRHHYLIDIGPDLGLGLEKILPRPRLG